MEKKLNLTAYPLGCKFLNDIGSFVPVPTFRIFAFKGVFALEAII
jgi:hypothetical protein